MRRQPHNLPCARRVVLQRISSRSKAGIADRIQLQTQRDPRLNRQLQGSCRCVWRQTIWITCMAAMAKFLHRYAARLFHPIASGIELAVRLFPTTQHRADREQPTACNVYRRYARGDVVCKPGQIVDGLYTVVSGYLESRIPNPATGEDFVRLIGEGDHWGERSLTGRFETQGTLTAVEDTRVLILGKEDFRSLRATFPPLDDYFKHVSEKIYAPALRQTSTAFCRGT